MKHYPGPWEESTLSPGAIVAPKEPEAGHDEAHHYGGPCVCESVLPANMPIILAAPDMYDAAKELVKRCTENPEFACSLPHSVNFALLGLEGVLAKIDGAKP